MKTQNGAFWRPERIQSSVRIKSFFTSRTFLGAATILFGLKGLGGSFNSLFTFLGIPELHGPFVGGVLGLLITAYCLWYALSPIGTDSGARPNPRRPIRLLIIFGLLLVAGTVVRINKIQTLPIDEGRADMLVTIQSQIGDFTEGKDPYLPYVTGQGRTLQRFYLPVVWLSYTPLYLLGIDIRYLNIIVQMLVLCLLLSCFIRKRAYPDLSQKESEILFLALIALFCFSKQKIADVVDVQTAVFWLFYSLALWAESLGKRWVTHLVIPLVLVCRHPAVLLFLPFFLFLFLRDRKRFWLLSASTILIASLLIFPFMQHPYNIVESILFYGASVKDAPIEVTSMFYGGTSLLQRTHLTWLQKPIQLTGLIVALIFILRRRELDTVQALCLGGIAYVSFIFLVSSTPQYIWAEPLLLIYFLLNRPNRNLEVVGRTRIT